MRNFFELSFGKLRQNRQTGTGSAIICPICDGRFRYHEVSRAFMLKTKTARPAKAGTSNLVKAETAKEVRGGDQYFSRAVGKALEVLEFLQAELKPLP